jgi:hypothetical protein
VQTSLFAQGFVTGQAGNGTTSRVLLLVNKGGAVLTAGLEPGWPAGSDCTATSTDASMGLYDTPLAKPCPAAAHIGPGRPGAVKHPKRSP